MSPKFKILDKKNIHDGFFKMNEVTLKYKKYDGNWSNEIKRELFGGAQVSAVLPYDPVNKKIVLIQQFRPGTISKDNQNYLDEIVAGIIKVLKDDIKAIHHRQPVILYKTDL